MGTRSFVAILIGIPYYNVPEYFWQAVGLVPGYIYVPQGLPDQVIEAVLIGGRTRTRGAAARGRGRGVR